MALLDWNRWYLVDAASVAGWDSQAETWNTPIALPNLQSFKLSPTTDTDSMQIYGANEHFLSVLTGCEIELEFGGLAADAYAEMTGITPTESGTATRSWEFEGGNNLDYFGMIARLKVDGPGNALVYLPRMKLDSVLGLEAAKENKFLIPTTKAMCGRLRLEDGTLYSVYRLKEFDSAQSIPGDFNTAFTSL